jgi:hypothetical protein
MSDLPPGYELNRVIAEKAMGWQDACALWEKCDDEHHDGGGVPNDHEAVDRLYYSRLTFPALSWDNVEGGGRATIALRNHEEAKGDITELPEWSPSERIEDAWEVVERMRALGFTFNLRSPGIITVGDGYYKCDRWYAVFQSGAQEAAAVYDKEGEANADAAPLAICLAALKAVTP